MLGTNSFAQGPFYLKAHWDFTNAFSTATDLSGNGHNGVVIGCTPVPGCSGAPNTALRFRPGNWVQVPGSTDFCHQEWTINIVARVLAFNPSGLTRQYSTLLSHEIRTGAKYYSIDVSDEPFDYSTAYNPLNQQLFASSSCYLVPPPPAPLFWGQPVKLGCWYCFTAVNRPTTTGNVIDLYVNGIYLNTYPWPVGCPGSCGPLDLLIGKGTYGGFTTWFDGEIDDIQIYRNAMNQNDVMQYFPCPCPATPDCGGNGGSGPTVPCTNTIDDIDVVSSLSTPFKRSYFVSTSPASFGNIRWEVNGILVATLASTSTFSYTYPAPGSYTVCAYLFDPATGSDCDTLCFETCLSDAGYKPAPNTRETRPSSMPHFGSVHPNPSQSYLSIPLRGYSGTVEVLVSGMDGKRVLQQSFSQKATDTELKINTEHLAPGSYLININAGATGSQQKFIKQ